MRFVQLWFSSNTKFKTGKTQETTKKDQFLSKRSTLLFVFVFVNRKQKKFNFSMTCNFCCCYVLPTVKTVDEQTWFNVQLSCAAKVKIVLLFLKTKKIVLNKISEMSINCSVFNRKFLSKPIE